MSKIGTNCGVYKIVNTLPNECDGICKVYVGSSVNLKSRKYEHFRLLKNNKHCNKHLQRAYNKFGAKYFIFEVIEYLDSNLDRALLRAELLKKEQSWMNSLKVCEEEGKYGYNFLPTAGSPLGTKRDSPSKETRERIGRAQRGKIVSEDTRKKLGASKKGNKYWLGKNHSEESKEKMRLIQLGSTRSVETRQKISNSQKGRKQSKEFIKKRVSAREGYKHSEETKAKMRANSNRKCILNLTTNEIFGSIKEASLKYGLNQANIGSVCAGNRTRAGGYLWSYLTEGER